MEKYGERPNVIHRKPFEIDDLVKDIRSIFFDLQKISAWTLKIILNGRGKKWKA